MPRSKDEIQTIAYRATKAIVDSLPEDFRFVLIVAEYPSAKVRAEGEDMAVVTTNGRAGEEAVMRALVEQATELQYDYSEGRKSTAAIERGED